MHKKLWIQAGLFITLYLLVLGTAQADFRKALHALQNGDGEKVLAEVRDAVEKKNDDGLILFISNLELDELLATSIVFHDSQENVRINDALRDGAVVAPPWKITLGDKGVAQLFQLLETATQESTLESQYRYTSLRYGNMRRLKFNARNNYASSEKIPENEKNYYEKLEVLIGKGYTDAAMDLYFKNLFYKNVQESSNWLNKAADLGHTGALLIKATDLLIGDNSKDEVVGLRLVKQSLSKPDADFYYYLIANKLSTYYFAKGDDYSLMQAYLWSLVALTNSRTGLVPSSLIELKKSGALAKVALAEDQAWSDSFNKTEALLKSYGVTDISKNYEINNLPKILKEIKQFELPELIRNHKFSFQKQPIVSFHNFYYDPIFSWEIAPIRNFLIDVYEDGRINFSLGPRFSRSQNIETFLTINPEDVQQLLAEIKSSGFSEVPLISNGKYAAGCGLADCRDFYPDLIGTYPRTLFIIVRDNKESRTVMFNSRQGDSVPSFFAKTFSFIEKRFHFQEYRCGNIKGKYHHYCIDQDNLFLDRQ